MKDNLSTFLQQADQEEREKQIFGGNVYGMSHRFPSLFVVNDEKDEEDRHYYRERFINYTKLVNHMANSCGADLALLFAEVYSLHEINEESINNLDVKNKVITDFCTEALAHLSLAINQSQKLLNDLENYESTDDIPYEINGKDYCFLVMMINNLFYYYTTIVCFITNKRYLNKEFIGSISERLAFIVSEEYESIKRMFKVIECYRELENGPTFH